MKGVLIDSNVVLDVFGDDPDWADWSIDQISRLAEQAPLYINPMVYCEISIGFERFEAVEHAIGEVGLVMREIPKEALFLAGKVFLEYRRRGGVRSSPPPEFFVGAHAAVERLPLLTRDTRRVSHYFPGVELISPENH